jgi:hypothetical protein
MAIQIFEIPTGETKFEVFEVSPKSGRFLDRYYGVNELDALHIYNKLIDANKQRIFRVNGSDRMRYTK